MPKIPIYNAQGTKKVQAPEPMLNANEAGAPYEGLKTLGKATSQLGSVMDKIDAKFKMAENNNQYSQAMIGAKQFFSEDKEVALNNNDITDWQTKHDSSLSNKRTELSGKIKDNATRSQFLRNFDLSSIDHRVSIKNGYRKKINSQGRVLLEQDLEMDKESYINAGTEEDRSRILQESKARINQSVGSGFYTREKAEELKEKYEKAFATASFWDLIDSDPKLALDAVLNGLIDVSAEEKAKLEKTARSYIKKAEADQKAEIKENQEKNYKDISWSLFQGKEEHSQKTIEKLVEDGELDSSKAEILIETILSSSDEKNRDLAVWAKLKGDSLDSDIGVDAFLVSVHKAKQKGFITFDEAQSLLGTKITKGKTSDNATTKNSARNLKQWVEIEGMELFDETAEAKVLQNFYDMVESENATGDRIKEIGEIVKQNWRNSQFPEYSNLEKTPNYTYQDGSIEPLIKSKETITPDYVYNPEDQTVTKYDGKEKQFYSVYVPEKGVTIGLPYTVDDEALRDIVEQQFYPDLYGKNIFQRFIAGVKEMLLPEADKTEIEAEQEGALLREDQESFGFDDETPDIPISKQTIDDVVFNRPTAESVSELYDTPHIYEPVTTIGQKLSDTTESIAYSIEKFALGGSRSVVEHPVKAIGGLLQEYGELTADVPLAMYPPTVFSDKITTFGKRISKNITELADTILPDSVSKETDTAVEEFAGKLGSGFGSLASFVGIGLMTGGNAWIPAMVEGIMAKGTKYPEAREKGKTAGEASLISSGLGAVTSAFGAIGFNFLFKNYGGRLMNVGIRSFTEGTQELFQTGGEQAIDIATGLRGYKGLPELVKEQVESFFIGSLVSAPTSVMIDYAQDQGLIKQLQDAGINKQSARKIVKQMQKNVQQEAETVAEEEIEKATDSMDKTEAQREQMVDDLQKPKDEGGRGLTQEEAETCADEHLVDGTDVLTVPEDMQEEPTPTPEPETEVEQQIKGERLKVLADEKKSREKKGLPTEKIEARIKEVMLEVKKQKETWEMTKAELRDKLWDEHLKEYPADKTGDNKQIAQDRVFRRADFQHGGEVTTAISEGKPVPAKVLKDYPDLQKQIKPKQEGSKPKPVAPAVKETETLPKVYSTRKLNFADKERLDKVKYGKQKGFTNIQKDVFVAKLLEAREDILKENPATRNTEMENVPFISKTETDILNNAGSWIKKKGEVNNQYTTISQSQANTFMKNVSKYEQLGLIKSKIKNPSQPKDYEITDAGGRASFMYNENAFIEGDDQIIKIKIPDDGTFTVINTIDGINNMLRRLKVKSDIIDKISTPKQEITKPKKPTSKEGGFIDFSRPTPEETGIQAKPKKWTPRTNGKINTKSGKQSQTESFEKYLQIYEEKQSVEAVMDSISAFYGSLDWDKTQTKTNEDRRKKELPDTYNRDVVSMYIELRNHPEIIDKHYDKLPDRVKDIVDGISTIGETEIKYAKEMMERYQELGEMGQKLGILDSMHEDYINHVWLRDKKNIAKAKTAGMQFIGGKFVHGKKRIFDSFLEGIAKGYEPLTLDSAELLAVYEDRFFKAVHSKVFIEQLKSMVLPNGERAVEFASLKNDNYVTVNHPALTKYKYIGQKIDHKTGKTVPNIVRKELVVHRDVAPAVKDVLEGSKIRNVPGIKQLLQWGALGKTTLLYFSPFHFTALGKTAVFYGVNPLWFGGNNYVTGLDLVVNEDPIVKHGVQVGRLGLAGSSHIETATIIANQGIAWLNNIDKGFASDRMLNAKKWFDKRLWDHYFTGLKALSYRMEYLKNIDRYKGLNRDEIAKITARDINDNFGGLAWEKVGISPSTLDGLRLAKLAPDWTWSNWRFFGNAAKVNDILRYLKGNRVPIFSEDGKITGFQKLHEWRNTTKGTSRFMGKVYSTLGLATMMSNIIMHGNPFPHEDNDMWSKFWMIKLPYTDEHGRAKYLDLFGHLAEPLRAVTALGRWGAGKVSIPARTIADQIKGTNWNGDWLGNVDDLVQEGRITRTKYKDRPDPGAFGWKILPIRVIHFFDVMSPITMDTIGDVAKGRRSILEGVVNLSGFAIRSGKAMGGVKDEKRRKKLTREAYKKEGGFSQKVIKKLFRQYE